MEPEAITTLCQLGEQNSANIIDDIRPGPKMPVGLTVTISKQ
jgi:hypothetical protein